MRTLSEIIGHDAVTQLAFEGWQIVPILEISVGDDVADKLNGMWQGVVSNIHMVDTGVLAPGYITWEHFSAPDWQAEAIERGYALYCPADGEFAWVGECEDLQTKKEPE